MDLTPYLDRLREDLTTSASAGDEDMQRAAGVLSAALEPAARLTLMNALADMAEEVTSRLDGPTVDVRLDGRDVRVVVDGGVTGGGEAAGAGPGADGASHGDAAARGFSFGDIAGSSGDISRITLRIVEQIKEQAEQAAAAQGLSLNSFVAQAVQQALRASAQGQHGHPGHRRARTHERPGRGPQQRRGHDGPGHAGNDDRNNGRNNAEHDRDREAGGTRGDHEQRPGTDRSHLHGWVEG